MSIAASVLITPSRILLELVAALALGAAVVGVVIGFGTVGELAWWARLVCAFLCLLIALAGFVRALRYHKTYHIDISGGGQIRLRSVAVDKKYSFLGSNNLIEESALVTLLPDSTILPFFMLLRLKFEDGHIHNIPILYDCLPEDSFRAVSVACRWIKSCF